MKCSAWQSTKSKQYFSNLPCWCGIMWFGKYLCDQGVISPKRLIDLLDQMYGFRDPIGRLALKNRMLNVHQVSEILKYQLDHPLPFGEAAEKLGFLFSDQIDFLLGLQQRQKCLAEMLVESGTLTQDRLNELENGFRNHHLPA